MAELFCEDELLLRAVWPPNRRPNFWVGNKRLSSAALKDKSGLSVDRTAERTVQSALAFTKSRLQGCIVSFSVPACHSVHACLKYLPSKDNPYHSEIHGSETEIMLSDTQALLLARKAVLEYEPPELP